MSREDGGTAFPIPATLNNGNLVRSPAPGMSLRDWFAGQAATGIIVARSWNVIHNSPEQCAETAYAIADAMLAERGKA